MLAPVLRVTRTPQHGAPVSRTRPCVKRGAHRRATACVDRECETGGAAARRRGGQGYTVVASEALEQLAARDLCCCLTHARPAGGVMCTVGSR